MKEFSETLHGGYAQTFEITRVLANERSEFQHILLFENPVFGRVLVLDGIVQITERDEHTYSEMLAHPPVFEHGQVERVMIAGGGDGAVAEEVLKHASVRIVDLVDIDRRVVDLARKHLRSVHRDVFTDSRLHVHFEDAARFLDAHWDRYDLIIADRPDPVGAAESLFAGAFYEKVAKALRGAGIAVFQSGVPFFQGDELREVCRNMRMVWSGVSTYLVVTPTYTGGPMAITRGCEVPLDKQRMDAAIRRAVSANCSTKTYTSDVHRAAYALPAWLREIAEDVQSGLATCPDEVAT